MEVELTKLYFRVYCSFWKKCVCLDSNFQSIHKAFNSYLYCKDVFEILEVEYLVLWAKTYKDWQFESRKNKHLGMLLYTSAYTFLY